MDLSGSERLPGEGVSEMGLEKYGIQKENAEEKQG